jgi:hypothetical protein
MSSNKFLVVLLVASLAVAMPQTGQTAPIYPKDDIGFFAAVLVGVGMVVGAFVTKNIIAAVSDKKASDLGSIKVDTKLIKFQIDDIDFNGQVEGHSYTSDPGWGTGYVTGDGELSFSVPLGTDCISQPTECAVNLAINVTPDLRVSIYDPYKESGSASFSASLSSPQLGSIYGYGSSITNGSFNTPDSKKFSFSVVPGTQVNLVFHAENSAQGQVPEPSALSLILLGLFGIFRTRQPA